MWEPLKRHWVAEYCCRLLLSSIVFAQKHRKFMQIRRQQSFFKKTKKQKHMAGKSQKFRQQFSYRFSNNLSTMLHFKIGLKKHPCPLVTKSTICNIWNTWFLISGGFNPCFASIYRYINSFNPTPSTRYSISLDCDLNSEKSIVLNGIPRSGIRGS